jgi:hypothetical protein
MIFLKKGIKEVYSPVSDRFEVLSNVVNLDKKYFQYLTQFLEEQAEAFYVEEEDIDLSDKGIYIEVEHGDDPGMNRDFIKIEIYVNDTGLLSIANAINNNKQDLIELYDRYKTK